MKRFSYAVSLASFLFLNVYCADNKSYSDYPELKKDWSYCFEFTWFGPDYDNVTRYNGTCADYLEETRAEGIPCAAPIVISYDGTLPNMTYLWDKHKESILCKRNVNQRCIKYTYFFNNQIANISYSCAKVQHNTGGFIDSGCYKQTLSPGYDKEVCVCKSTSGIYAPCNKSPSFKNYLTYILIGATFFIVKLIF